MKVTGYILPEKTESRDEDSEEEDEEEENAPEFLDMREIKSVSSGGHMFSSSIPPIKKVEIQDLCGQIYQVEGRFALRSPWWEVTCCVQRQRNRLVVDGFPSYRLRSDLDRHVVSLFLTACQVQSDFISQFFKLLPPNRDVSISNLVDILGDFSEGENAAIAQSITAQLSSSVAGRQVHVSCLYPHVMKYLPTLLPGQFAKLLGISKRREILPATQATQAGRAALASEQEEEDVGLSLLGKLEAIITNDVWKLGFSYLVYKELKLVRCEAQLKAFMGCSLLQKIPLLQQNVLWAYEQLKKHCHSTGSTYMDQPSLCSVLRKVPGMSDEQAWKAIHFLREQAVVVCDKQKVVLQNFHLYETGIAECLCSLVERGPWRIPVNVREMLIAAAQERQQKKMQKPENMTTHPDEDAHFADDPSAANSKYPPVAHAHSEERPFIKAEPKTPPHSSPENSEQTAAPGQAAAHPDLCLPELDPDQVRAAEMICANPVTVISGKGGCGKTTVVSELFSTALQRSSCEQQQVHKVEYDGVAGESLEWEEPPASPSLLTQREEEKEETRALHSTAEILITAPTGRAASLLSKRSGFSAFTLHQVLFSFMKTAKDEEGLPVNWKFRHVRVLVVDEGSLVCVQLLHSVLSMLTKHAQLSKFIMLGDVKQLSSIQPGNVLHDLFHSLKPIQWAVEMRTNHRAESQLIVKNAELISDMGMKRVCRPLDFDATVDLNGSCSMPSAEKKFILVRLPSEGASDDLQRAVKLLIDSAPGLQNHSTSQFIAFRR
ncbi:hypothetical protein LDENG_00167510 [Lucifuga dentata]|nr:hypothetical protein LDENG_00167510 [Lucifuga dentata]